MSSTNFPTPPTVKVLTNFGQVQFELFSVPTGTFLSVFVNSWGKKLNCRKSNGFSVTGRLYFWLAGGQYEGSYPLGSWRGTAGLGFRCSPLLWANVAFVSAPSLWACSHGLRARPLWPILSMIERLAGFCRIRTPARCPFSSLSGISCGLSGCYESFLPMIASLNAPYSVSAFVRSTHLARMMSVDWAISRACAKSSLELSASFGSALSWSATALFNTIFELVGVVELRVVSRVSLNFLLPQLARPTLFQNAQSPLRRFYQDDDSSLFQRQI